MQDFFILWMEGGYYLGYIEEVKLVQNLNFLLQLQLLILFVILQLLILLAASLIIMMAPRINNNYRIAVREKTFVDWYEGSISWIKLSQNVRVMGVKFHGENFCGCF